MMKARAGYFAYVSYLDEILGELKTCFIILPSYAKMLTRFCIARNRRPREQIEISINAE